MKNISKIIINKISDQLLINRKYILLNLNLNCNFGIDYLDIIEIIAMFEDKFSIKISKKTTSKFVTINDIIKYIKLHIRC